MQHVKFVQCALMPEANLENAKAYQVFYFCYKIESNDKTSFDPLLVRLDTLSQTPTATRLMYTQSGCAAANGYFSIFCLCTVFERELDPFEWN